MSEVEAIEVLIKAGSIIPMKGKYQLTGSFHRNYFPISSEGLIVQKKEVALSTEVIDTTSLFMEFIKQCDIPTRTMNGRGGHYWINRFHKDGAKEFARILSKENVNIQVLIASTKLYYIQTKECAKTINNYIVEGIWRTGYQSMLESANKGTLQEDIKKELTPFGKDI